MPVKRDPRPTDLVFSPLHEFLKIFAQNRTSTLESGFISETSLAIGEKCAPGRSTDPGKLRAILRRCWKASGSRSDGSGFDGRKATNTPREIS